MTKGYRLISADSHLEISPERWRQRVPVKYRDRAPRLVKLADGGDGILIEGRPIYILGLAITGKPYAEHKISGVTYEGGAGAGSPENRLKEQDQDGIDAEVMFTSAGNLNMWRAIEDGEAYTSVLHAYNEFLAEEYCAAARDRLMAMGVIPGSGIGDAIKEMEYCARMGLRGVMLNSFPSGKGFPTPEDDKFWAAAIDLQMPITVHVGFIGGRGGPSFKYKHQPAASSFGNDPIRVLTRFGGASALNSVQLILAGVFDRLPKLRIFWAETQIGWLPHFFEQLDDVYERSRYWMENSFGLEPLKRRPSEYIREHCWWGFVYDPIGMRLRHEIGISRVMWGNDFPHSAGNWPHSEDKVEELMKEVPQEERQRMLVGNAVQYFHLEKA